MSTAMLRAILLGFASLTLAAAGSAQCATPPQWSLFGPATFPTSQQPVVPMASDGGQGAYVASVFPTLGGSRIARADGVGWLPLGGGIPDGEVACMLRRANGDLLVGGSFSSAGGQPLPFLARWNQTNWSPLAPAPNGAVTNLVALANGDVAIGGVFSSVGGVSAGGLAIWNGVAWTGLANGMELIDLAAGPSGDLLALGRQLVGGSTAHRVMRWSGGSWTQLGNVDAQVANAAALLVLPDGSVIVGGRLWLVRWTGSTWVQFGQVSTFGSAQVLDLQLHPDGGVIISGSFTAISIPALAPQVTAAARGIARWHPSSGALDGLGSSSALGFVVGAVDTVHRPVIMADGGLAVSATYPFGGQWVPLLRVAPGCPPVVASTGVGCSGSAGPNVLTATTQPWLGNTFHARGTGMPPISLALAVTSLAPTTVPLALVLPIAGPGCDGLLSPTLTELLVPSGGAVDVGLALPDVPAAAGLQVFQYLATIEFDAVGNALALTSTNVLALTLGRL